METAMKLLLMFLAINATLLIAGLLETYVVTPIVRRIQK